MCNFLVWKEEVGAHKEFVFDSCKCDVIFWTLIFITKYTIRYPHRTTFHTHKLVNIRCSIRPPPKILSCNNIGRDIIIIISICPEAELKLRMDLVLNYNWPFSKIWIITKFNVFSKVIECEKYLFKHLRNFISFLACLILINITSYNFKWIWNSFCIIWVGIFNWYKITQTFEIWTNALW